MLDFYRIFSQLVSSTTPSFNIINNNGATSLNIYSYHNCMLCSYQVTRKYQYWIIYFKNEVDS